MTNEKKYLNIIIEKFQVYDVDWMNFKINKDSPLTYHHIIPRKKRGLTTEDNCAPLTIDSHPYIHIIERKNPIIFKQISRLFQELNESQIPPTEEYFDKVEFLKEKYEQRVVRIYKK